MNPVKANLVDQIRQWPGFTVLPDIWGKRQTVVRPASVDPGYPDEASYTPQPPPGAWSEMPLEEARAEALALIALAEDRYRKKRAVRTSAASRRKPDALNSQAIGSPRTSLGPATHRSAHPTPTRPTSNPLGHKMIA